MKVVIILLVFFYFSVDNSVAKNKETLAVNRDFDQRVSNRLKRALFQKVKSSHTCPPNAFVCGDGKCLPATKKCDSVADCSDESDEKFCSKQNCSNGLFTCSNGKCIPPLWKCDRENDCGDGSDEQNCDYKCKDNEFHCKNGSIICISSKWRCDGETDCMDGSDEENCENYTCPDTKFSCGPPHDICINRKWVCDGDKNCPDGSDENNCSTSTLVEEKATDQSNSKNGDHEDWMFTCLNKNCVPYSRICDGIDNCGDGSDEQNCEPPQRIECGRYKFLCKSSWICIPSAWKCDGEEDCTDGSDEENCPRSTTEG